MKEHLARAVSDLGGLSPSQPHAQEWPDSSLARACLPWRRAHTYACLHVDLPEPLRNQIVWPWHLPGPVEGPLTRRVASVNGHLFLHRKLEGYLVTLKSPSSVPESTPLECLSIFVCLGCDLTLLFWLNYILSTFLG